MRKKYLPALAALATIALASPVLSDAAEAESSAEVAMPQTQATAEKCTGTVVDPDG